MITLYTFELNYETGAVKRGAQECDDYDEDMTHHVDFDIHFKTLYAESLVSAQDAEAQVMEYATKLAGQLNTAIINTWGSNESIHH